MKPVLILLADAGRARLMLARSRNLPPEELRQWVHPEARMRTRELRRDESLPRTHDRMGNHRHGIEPHQAPDAHEAEAFARQISEGLDEVLHEHAQARIALFAPPRFLGCLREHLSSAAARAVVHEQDSELTMLPPRELLDRLPDTVWHQL